MYEIGLKWKKEKQKHSTCQPNKYHKVVIICEVPVGPLIF